MENLEVLVTSSRKKGQAAGIVSIVLAGAAIFFTVILCVSRL